MWLIIGLIAGAVILGFLQWIRSKNVSIAWYEWLIGIVGLALLFFTIQNSLASIAELEPQAASMFLLVTGLPGLIMLAVVWQLIARRTKKI